MRHAELEILFNEHARAVHAAVYRVTLDSASSEDATQEAFIRLLTRPPQDHRNIAAWLKRVAVNYAIDVLRRSNRQKPIGDWDFEAPVVTDNSDVIDAELSDELKEALSRLKPAHRAAILAVDKDGMSYNDAADMLGIHLNKLKTDLLRARRALHDALKGTTIAGEAGRKE
ncbi:MAG: RNA polymerase sigma factor [Planctomycetes bacterium]|nr:RNA polymerase sigma factor [Planctomycetota bacterium]